MRDVMGVINIDLRDDVLGELTSKRCAASVPFGGRYRLIDFMLSNMVNSGVTNVGVFSPKKHRSIMDHLRSGKAWDLNRNQEGLLFLVPDIENTYYVSSGNLQEFYNHLEYFKRSTQEYVIVAESNIICNIDFANAVNYHKENGADVTVFYCDKDLLEDNNLRISGQKGLEVRDGRVIEIENQPGALECDKLLLRIYVLSKSLLIDLIEECIAHEGCDLLRDGIIGNMSKLEVYGYHYSGYTAVIDSLINYYECSMNLMKEQIWKELFFYPGQILTKVKHEPPSKYHETAVVDNSLIANGCIIEGTVRNSILFRGVRVHKGAYIKDSIIMQKSEISEDAYLERAILDKEVCISNGRHLVSQNENGMPVVVPKRKTV